MSFEDKFGSKPQERRETDGKAEFEAQELELKEALTNFRSSMQAWSEAACSRPRTMEQVVRGRTWRLASGWALGCAMAAASVSGVVYQQRHQQEMARAAAAQAQRVAEQKLAAEQLAREDEEDLLAKVDSDVAREVPSAMEPLAQLMSDDDAK
jgi:uncharacterized protein HemX